jgi:hypothetical protein
VLGGDGQPLDVGRISYTTTLAIRRALTARDQGCAFPGCDRPPGWTDAHHIVHWADGGRTSVDNMVLLCGAHHRAVHHDDWVVRIAGNGLPEFIPPRWSDPSQAPRSRPWRAELAALAASNSGKSPAAHQGSANAGTVAPGQEQAAPGQEQDAPGQEQDARGQEQDARGHEQDARRNQEKGPVKPC